MLARLRDDLKTAMKQRDATAVRVLRMVLSELHNREIERGGALDEDDGIAVLRKAVKQREEAAEQFAAGGRDDRAEDERAEIEILEKYLPRMLDEAELMAAVDEVIADVGAGSAADLGRVMGELMSRHRGRVDGKTANRIVRERLEKPREAAEEP